MNRGTRHASLTGLLIVTAAATVAMGAPANAAEDPDVRGFPVIVPDWYTSAPAFSYGDGAPAPFIDESLRNQGLTATYYRPYGTGPSYGQPDISIAYRPSESMTPSDSFDLDFSAFEHLETDMGTTLTDAIVIPISDSESDDAEIQPEVSVHGALLTVTRPVISDDCEAADVSTYVFQAALLGSNGSKFLVEVGIDFGERPTAIQTAHDTTCRAAAVAAESNELGDADGDPTGEAGDLGATTQIVETQASNPWPSIFVVAFVALIIWLTSRFHFFRKLSELRSQRQSHPHRFDDDENPVTHSSTTMSKKRDVREKVLDFLDKPRNAKNGSEFDLDE